MCLFSHYIYHLFVAGLSLTTHSKSLHQWRPTVGPNCGCTSLGSLYSGHVSLFCVKRLLTCDYPANMRRWANVGLILAHRLWHWTSIKPILTHPVVFAGYCILKDSAHCIYTVIITTRPARPIYKVESNQILLIMVCGRWSVNQIIRFGSFFSSFELKQLQVNEKYKPTIWQLSCHSQGILSCLLAQKRCGCDISLLLYP